MRGSGVDVTQVLFARDRRQQLQQQILTEYQKPLLCFTMNIAGPIKRSRLGDLAFLAGLDCLAQQLGKPLFSHLLWEDTGCEAFLVYDRPAQELKAICQSIEETAPAGRLYDMDVLDLTGEKLSRGEGRRCLVCGGPVAVCSRSRAHGLGQISAATRRLLMAAAPEYLAEKAVQALLEEVRLTPKPGRVDRANNGAHRDMDLALFEKSAETLRPYFIRAVELGMDDPHCMPQLQQEGLKAEEAMFAATGGVNTHKGALYAFGLLLAAMGSCLVRMDQLFFRASVLASAGKAPGAETHGSDVRRQYGAKGARQEAEEGFPSAREALAYLQSHEGDAIGALLHIMGCCADTNLLYRGGEEGLLFARDWAKRVLAAPMEQRESLLREMDEAFIEKNLSPGGSADVLAQALFLQSTRQIWENE